MRLEQFLVGRVPSRGVPGFFNDLLRGGAAGLFLLAACLAHAATSAWVYPGPSGRLIQQPDVQGNRIVDHSGVGYQGGTVALPAVPVVLTISPVPGDNMANIQSALNQIAAMAPDSNGFRGALLLTAGVYAISDSVSINASGIVLRGVGDGTNGTVLYSTSTDGPDNGQNQLQGLVVISGSSRPIAVSGTSNNIIDNYVPVGSRSFNVDGAGVLNVGDHVIVHRPSTANWITAIGMDQLRAPWQPGSVDVDAERVITCIEGTHIILDEPITTALDQQYGGGSIYKYTWPQRLNNIGIEYLRGQSYYDPGNTNDEDHAWVCLRFSNTENSWVRHVTSQYFGKSCVSLQPGSKYITVTECQCLDPISLIESERRYAFDLNSCQFCLVQDCFTRQDRHSFITQSLTDGPNVFVDGLAEQAYDLAGPHVRWASGILFDNITTDNGMTIANQGNSGASGHGWCGANCVIWDSSAAFYTVEGPPTANNWLIGSLGPLQAGGGGNAGPHGPGTYDSLGTNVFPNSLYYAQLQDRIAVPNLQTREYRLGAINQFSNSGPAGTSVTLDPVWSNTVAAAAGSAPLDGFNIVTHHHWVPCTFNFALAPNERVVAATLSLSLLAATSTVTNDVLYLDSLANGYSFNSLGWLPVSTTNPTVRVMDLSGQLSLLADGQLNLALQDDVGVDWATLGIQVAPVLTVFTNALAPVANATVRAGAYATNTFGAGSLLTANEAPLPDNEQQAYLRWDLSGVTGKILQAKVRLVPVNVGRSGIEQGATLANTDSWSEAAITWNNQPGGGKRFATWMPVAGVPVEFTVPPQLMDAFATDQQLSLQLFSLYNVGVLGSVDYASREYPDPAWRPQLILVISNTAPVLSAITNATIFQDTSTGPMPFTAGDAESSPGSLAATAASSNLGLVPVQNIVFGGSGSNRTVTITPAPNQTGSATITITVTDVGGLTAADNFTLTVMPYTNASFWVSATPAGQTISPGGSASYAASILTTNGFTNDVTLSLSGLPAGANGSFSPPSVSGVGNSTLTVTTSTNTPAGAYALTLAGTGGGLTRSTSVTLNISGFVLSASPSAQNVPTNATTTFSVSLAATNGFADSVALSVSGLPPGASASFAPPSLGSSGTSILSVTTASATPTGIYPLTITGAGGSLTRTAAVSLNVFDFSLAGTPGTQTVTPSAAVNYSVSVAGTAGISNNVALSLSGLPPGATASFSPASLSGSGNSTLTVAAALTTPVGSYPLTITGTSGALTHNATITLNVTDFALSATPAAQTLRAGGATNFTVSVGASNGFSGSVALSVSGLPAGATASFTPASLSGSGTSTLAVTTATNTPAGSYPLTIAGTSGTLTHNVTVMLNLASFSLSATPQSRTVTSGAGDSFTATVTATNGFTSNVVFAVTGLPTGAGASFTPATVNGSGSSTLNITTLNATPAGNYILTVTATSGNIVQTATVTLKVNDFSVAAAPDTQNVTASVGTSFAVAVTTNNGFGGTVTLSVSGLPAYATASFNPPSLSVSGTSTLSLTTSNATPGGSYPLTITGTSGGLTRTTNVTLNVTGLAAGFVLSATPNARTVPPGGGTNYSVSVNGANGFSGSVALSLSGLPSGANASFSPASVSGSGSSTLTVTTTSGATPPGAYPLVLTGISGSLTNSTTNILNVFDFSLSASPQSRTVLPGDSDTFTATIVGTAGISNLSVAMSLSGLPANSSASYSPTAISGSGVSTLSIFTSNNTPAGSYSLTLAGTFSGLSRTATVTLRVRDFTVAATPVSRSVTAGGGTNYTVTIGALNSFSGSVLLLASGLPAGASASFNPASVSGAGSSTLSVTTSNTTPGGTYTLTLSGISGSLTRATNVTLIVSGARYAPVLRVAGFSKGLLTLSVSGPAGPDYFLQSSSNLTSWAPLLSTNAPVPPFLWTDPNPASLPRRYYRALLGP